MSEQAPEQGELHDPGAGPTEAEELAAEHDEGGEG